MKTKIAKYHLTALFLLISLFSYTQKKQGFIPPSIDDEEIPVAKTELPVPEEGQDYVVKYFKGITDGVESRIAVKNLGYIIRPAMVQVISEDGRELAIELVKKNWDDIVRSGITKAGTYESSFKTALEFGVKISAKEVGIPFVVVISAGKELFPTSNLFVDASTMRSSDANKEMSTTNEADLMGEESGQSNSTLFIIIAIALVGILALLAVLVFKKKGKGAATLVIMLMTLSMNANEVKEVGPSEAGFPTDKITDPKDHYPRGPGDDDSLHGPDDDSHIPDPNPPGQPSLPTSCIETARNNDYGSSGDDGGIPLSKNPTNAGGDTSDPTNGGTAGGAAGEGAAPDFNVGSGNTQNTEQPRDSNNEQNDDASLEEQLEEARRQYERDRQDTRDAYDTRIKREQEDYRTDLRRLGESYARERLGIDDDETLSRIRDQETQSILDRGIEMNTRLVSARELHERILLAIDESYENQVSRIERDFESRQQDSESEDASEKDSHRQPKKDPDRSDDKDNTDDEHQAKRPNPPSEQPPGSRKRGIPNDQEKACECLEVAYADMRMQRERFEKLLMIGLHTKKVTDYGISWGDRYSGLHPVSSLAWQTQRTKVMKSINKFDDTYKKKYNEIIAEFYEAMMQINTCEDKLGVKNWYAKWGYIYYEFVKARYSSYK